MASKTQKQPIAIVGIGCRLPGGASNVDKFWNLLINKTDAVKTVPSERWDIRKFYHPGKELRADKLSTTQGGFLEESVDTFDPDFFGVSPREVSVLDPQQRVLMEVSYEAIEDAGFRISDLSGSKTGVFIGGFTFDYTIMQLDRESRHLLNSSCATGSQHTMLSNKLSYLYNLRGPSLTIDTACSSSLVAIHYACRELWSGECDIAMAGGVNMMLTPSLSIVMSSGKFLSPDGRCRSFDNAASGYVRGEGGAIVILKPLDKAERDGDKIYAVIRSTGINQDGRTNGITTPSYDAQKELVEKVYAEAGMDINQLHYIEAHGTGTPVGDPIEFKSLNSVLVEKGYTRDKCLIGSVKSNIGHLEAGAGVAGLIKAALCLRNKTVPPNLHFNTPNENLNYEKSKLRVPLETERLPEDGPSMAAVNSFGYGGTNAHVLLQEYVPRTGAKKAAKPKKRKDGFFVFPISAGSREALVKLAESYVNYLGKTTESFDDILFSAVFRRSHLRHRLAVAARSREELMERLAAFAAGNATKGVVYNERSEESLKPVFVFTGMGPQWWKMGRELYEKEPVFREALDKCDGIFRSIASWSVLKEMLKDEAESRIKETQIAQPANFFIQYGLTVMLEQYGVKAEAYVGHSVGEVASCYFSGALTLEEAITVSYNRSRLQAKMAGTGAMLAVSLKEEDVKTYLDLYTDVSIAAVNSPGSLTLAGNEDSLAAISEDLNVKGIFNRVLEVEVPYHSPLMDPIKDELYEALAGLQPAATATDLYSTVTGEKIEGTAINNGYWWLNVRNPVKFAASVDRLYEDGYRLFIEIGPHPVLKNSITECLAQNGRKGMLIHFMNRKEEEQLLFYSELGSLFTLGFPVKLEAFGSGGKLVDLPKYCWNRSVFWNEGRNHRQDRLGQAESLFLYQRLTSYYPSYEVELNSNFFPFIQDHVVQGKVIFPGAAYITSAVALGQRDVVAEGQIVTLEDIVFHQMLFIEPKYSQFLNTSYYPKTGQFQVLSRVEDENTAQWQLRASGRIAQNGMVSVHDKLDLDTIRQRCGIRMSPEVFYEKLARMKLEYGNLFRGVKSLLTSGYEVLAEIEAPEGLDENPYFIHPSLLDACFQAMVATAPEIEIVPVGIQKMHCIKPAGRKFYCYGVAVPYTENGLFSNMWICDESGNVLIAIENFECRELVLENKRSARSMDELFYYPEWEKITSAPLKDRNSDAAFYVCSPDAAAAEGLTAQLRSAGMTAFRLVPGSDALAGDDAIQLASESDWQQLSEHAAAQPKGARFVYIAPGSSAEADADDCYRVIDPLVKMAKTFSTAVKGEVPADIITVSAQRVLDEDICSGMSSFPLWGLGHVIANEFAGMPVRHYDLSERNGEASSMLNRDGGTMAVYLCQDYGETDIAIRSGVVYAKRMKQHEPDEQQDVKHTVNTTDCPVNLIYKDGAGIQSLQFEQISRSAPGPDEIEIRVSDSSVNFKDYLKVAGLIARKATENTFFDTSIGMDCSGEVVSVGENVKEYKPGDRVIAFAEQGAFRSYVNVHKDMAYFEPEALRGHHASHVLIVMFTVLSGLKDIARLKKGDKILIHNAAGGVGIAAIQYAKYIGAEIFATTSRQEKADFLRTMGVEHIYSVKNLEFVNGIKRDTNGYGVDVVLSALPGEVLYQSLALLAPYGRYIEIGKKDIIDNNGLPLQFFSKNLLFSSFDLDKILKERPDMIKQLFVDLYNAFRDGVFAPMPKAVFPAGKIKEAFELVESGTHIGKVVIDIADQSVEIAESSRHKLSFDGGTCLITGGTKGLGLELAKWIAEKGIKSVVLVSRSGLNEDTAEDVISFFEKKQVTLRVEKADIGNLDAVKQIVDSITRSLPPLRVIIHSAMVLDDGLLNDMNEERFLRVLRPKAEGALNLHKAVEGIALDQFVCISSISSLIGNPGQANYVAANAFLDGLAWYRRSRGLAATTINLGVLLETGVVQRDKNLQIILESAGIKGFGNSEVIAGFEYAMARNPVQAGFFDVDWALWAANNSRSSGISLFKEHIEKGKRSQGVNKEQMEFITHIKELDVRERHAFVTDVMKKILSAILKTPEQNINPDRSISLLGIDSVMVVELISAISKKFGVSMNPMDFLSGPAVNDISTSILTRLGDL